MSKQVDIVKQPANGHEDGVLELIHAVMHQFRAQQFQVLRDGPHDLTHMETKVLGFFARRPGATLSDLATHSGRDKAQLARLVKSLRDRELLAGTADELDKRNVRLALTEAGKAIQRSLKQQGGRLEARAVSGFDEADRQRLLELLGRVRRNLDADG
jgi:DNA-binding MarR family transcriptional regulator